MTSMTMMAPHKPKALAPLNRLRLRALAAVVLAVVASGTPAAWAAESTIALVHVNVIPMDRERVIPDQTVLVRGDRIVELGPAAKVKIPEGTTRVDATGRYLLPALAEMHAHIPGGQASDQDIERVLLLYAANGIGTIRGMLGHPRHLVLRERVAKGEVLGPTIYTSGPSLNGKSVPTKEDAIRMVTEQKAAGYDFLKIHPGIRREVFDALAMTADKVGIRFAGHVPLDVGLRRALEARYASVDHADGYIEAMARQHAADSQFFGVNLVDEVDESRLPELVALTKKAGTYVVPTEILLENSVSDEGPEALAKRPEMKYVAKEQLAQWIEQKKKMTADVPAPVRRQFIALRRKILKALHAGGVGLLLGSDAPQVWNVPGFSIHRELKALVDLGLSPYQALETGTRNVAAFLGRANEQGAVAVGQRADLLLLEGNPLEDITRTSRIAGVLLRGRWLSRGDLDQRLATAVK